MSIKTYRKMLIAALIITIVFGSIYVSYLINLYESQAAVSKIKTGLVIPGGMPVGLYLETNGVMVIGTEKIKNQKGEYVEPAKNLVKKGDYIMEINHQAVESKGQIIELLQKTSNNIVFLKLRRNMEYININVKVATDEKGDEKLGIWVKDDAQGLGTITFLTGQSKFGALGHGIQDTNTGEIIEISKGTLYETSIQNIIKGKSGFPGGLEGMIIYNKYNVIGEITKNNESGIYGNIEKIDRLFENQEAVPVASKNEIKKGKASIRCCVEGEVKEYQIEITDINHKPRELNKGIEIKVTDEELLEITGGIVQGMSGSPIMQDGKIIGAVTHVFVQDSTRGYGIFIENMLNNVTS